MEIRHIFLSVIGVDFVDNGYMYITQVNLHQKRRPNPSFRTAQHEVRFITTKKCSLPSRPLQSDRKENYTRIEVPTEFAKYQNILKFLYYVVSGLKEQYFYSFDVSINIILFFSQWKIPQF